MSSIIVTPKNPEELNFLVALLERLGTTPTLISDEEKEDLGLSLLMRDADRDDKVDRTEIMQKLRRA